MADTTLVDVATIFDAYFGRHPPFSHGKKAEFPDALALHAFGRAASARRTGFLVVSEDADSSTRTAAASAGLRPPVIFARAVAFAIGQPEDVDMNEILFRPTRQER